jgi:hypothetical protein
VAITAISGLKISRKIFIFLDNYNKNRKDITTYLKRELIIVRLMTAKIYRFRRIMSPKIAQKLLFKPRKNF